MSNKIAHINNDEFSELLCGLSLYPIGSKIAVAVSGGADSTCLAFLLKSFCINHKLNLIALIVDHKLREESTKEAIFVKNNLKSIDINSVILNREDIKLHSKIQEIAREDRYNLLLNYCKNNNISHLFLGHNQGDQIETYLMRVEKNQNLVGDSGMNAKICHKNAIILRPLLNTTKEQIKNTLINNNIKWVEDPSNTNEKYTRVKIRNYTAKLSANEITKIKEEIKNNSLKRISIENQFISFINEGIEINKNSLIKINMILFNNRNNILQKFILRKCIKFIGNNKHYPKIKIIEELLNKIAEYNLNKKFFRFSLGNCIIELSKDCLKIKKESKVSMNNIKNKNFEVLETSKESLFLNYFIIIS